MREYRQACGIDLELSRQGSYSGNLPIKEYNKARKPLGKITEIIRL